LCRHKTNEYMKYSELERKLKQAGCYEIRAGSNHPLWYSPVTGKIFPTGHHKSKEVMPGTLKNIQELSGVNI